MVVLEYLKSSALSDWLLISMAGFPTLIALHSVGMAVVVGLSLVVSLRLYDVIADFDLKLLPRLLDVAIWGFWLNLVTGIGIFITRGPEYVGSFVFLFKMLLVVVSAMILFWLRGALRTSIRVTGDVLVDEQARILSVLASTLWFGAVVAGRLIAYLSDLYR